MSTRERKDIVRFLSRSKGILLGLREELRLGYLWPELDSNSRWHHTDDVPYLLDQLHLHVEWLRSALGYAARAEMIEPLEKMTTLLQDYGNNRRLKN